MRQTVSAVAAHRVASAGPDRDTGGEDTEMTERLNLPGYIYSTIVAAEPERHGFDGFLIVETGGTFCAVRHAEWGKGTSVSEAVKNMKPIKELGFNVLDYQRTYFKLITLKIEGLLCRDLCDMVDEAVLGHAPRKLERNRIEWAS